MGGKYDGDVTRRGASGTLFELWFFPRRTIVERLVFTFLMFQLRRASLYVHRTYVYADVSNGRRSGYPCKLGRRRASEKPPHWMSRILETLRFFFPSTLRGFPSTRSGSESFFQQSPFGVSVVSFLAIPFTDSSSQVVCGFCNFNAHNVSFNVWIKFLRSSDEDYA